MGKHTTEPAAFADLGAAVPAAAALLAHSSGALRTMLADCTVAAGRNTDVEREAYHRIDSMLRHLVVALAGCPTTRRNLAAGHPSPVYGPDRDALVPVVSRHLIAATARAAGDQAAAVAATYEAVAALGTAYRTGRVRCPL